MQSLFSSERRPCQTPPSPRLALLSAAFLPHLISPFSPPLPTPSLQGPTRQTPPPHQISQIHPSPLHLKIMSPWLNTFLSWTHPHQIPMSSSFTRPSSHFLTPTSIPKVSLIHSWPPTPNGSWTRTILYHLSRQISMPFLILLSLSLLEAGVLPRRRT